MKRCNRHIGYEKNQHGFETPIHCGKSATVGVNGFIESPFWANRWQVETYWTCEGHANDLITRMTEKRDQIIENKGKFVEIDAGENNAMHHNEIDCPDIIEEIENGRY